MNIKDIKIGGFGKHNNKHYKFEESLNVLFGENECGKTTILSFIRAMFYGMDNRSQKISENYRKHYLPWSQSTMSGEIIFEHSGQSYYLKRMFGTSKRTDIIQLNNNITGEPISIKNDLEVGEHLLGMGAGAFESSIYIPQLCSIVNSSKDKNEELISKLTAMSGNGIDEVSLRQIETRLSDAITFLKAPRGVNGIIDKLENKKAELARALQDLQILGDKASQLRESLSKISLERTILLSKFEDINRRIMLWESSELLMNKNKIMNIKKQINEIDSKLMLLSDKAEYMNYQYVTNCREALVELSNNKRDVENCLLNIKDYSNHIDNLTFSLDKLQDVKNINMDFIDVLNTQINTTQTEIENVNKLEAEKKVALDKLSEVKNSALPVKIPKVFTFSLFLFLMLSISMIICGIVMISHFTNLLLGITAFSFSFIINTIIIVNLIYKFKKKKQVVINNKSELSRINDMHNMLTGTIKAIDIQLANRSSDGLQMTLSSLNNKRNSIFLLAGCQNYEDLQAKKLDVATLESRIAEAISAKKAIQIKYELSYKTFNQLKNELLLMLKKALVSNDFFSESDVKILLDKLDEQVRSYIFLSQQKEQLLNLLNETIGDSSIDKLEELWHNAEYELDKAGTEAFDWESILPGELINTLNSLKLSLKSIDTEITTLSSKLDVIYEGSVAPEEITSELEHVSSSIDEYLRLKDIYEIARDNIAIAFEELQKSFGPLLNQQATNIFKALTGERYNDLKISRNFDITIYNPDNSMLYDSAYFSGGTVDQVYLSFRLAISRIIAPANQAFPLFLDEVFTQYDDKRLAFACKFLIDFIKEQNCQIILSTCQKRVIDALTAIKPNVNVIYLNN